MASGPNRWGKMETVKILFSQASKSSHEIKMFAPWKENYDKARQHIKKQRHHFADKGPL